MHCFLGTLRVKDLPMEQKIVVIKPTTVDIWVVYFTFTLTQTLVCILTADYTVKPVLCSHSKKKTNYLLMQVKSIAECSKGLILQSFKPSLSCHLLLRSLVLSFLSGLFESFIVLTTYIVYMYFLLTCCKITILIKVRFFHN